MLCQYCIPNFVAAFLSDPVIDFPPKCSLCSEKFLPDQFDTCLPLLSEAQQAFLTSLSVEKELGENDDMRRCPFCQYFEIWPKENSALFFAC